MAFGEIGSPSYYYFDDVRVDRANFRVLKGDQACALEPRAFDLLVFLVENRGRVVEKPELFERVWKQAFVTDNALTRAIKEIRRAIGDDASSPRYIETIPKRGYRFIAEVKVFEEATPPAQPAQARRPEELVQALNYKILNKLGQGGGGAVYLAEDTRLERAVVLKFLSEELVSDERARRRFLREARLASLLDHPNICTIYEVNETDGMDFIVMQYAEGQTLKQFIASKPLDMETALPVAFQIANGLASAHEQGIIHRDIKPGNIVVTKKGQVKILDFGLAKSLVCSEADGANDQTELTRQGALLGTPAYMSPEQARGERADHRSDIFSFGVVLYEMATGRTPFKCRSEAETMNAVINTPHTPAAELNKRVPEEMARIIDRALVKDPRARYQSIEEMLDDLRQFATDSGSLTRSPALAGEALSSYVARRPRSLIASLQSAGARARWVMLAAAVAVAAVAIAFYWRSANLRWAREQIPLIEKLAAEQKYFEAYDAAIEVKKYLPDDATIGRLMPSISDAISVSTEPAGANVFLKRFSADETGKPAPRRLIGTTPITDLEIARGEYELSIEKDGYAPVERTISSILLRSGSALLPPDEPTVIKQKLIEADRLPARMVAVPGGDYTLVSWGKPTAASAHLDDYFIDRFEVTNREYKEFISAGGYLKKQYWKYPFVKKGKPISWDEATGEFRDRTGLPGPRNWSGQDIPEGKAQHPVTDITWYEAAAYAEFRGKKLPTLFQWEKAARNGVITYYSATIMPWGPVDVGGGVEHRANFKSTGTVPVDSFEFGMSPYGCYQMAGNVSEWCLNETSEGFTTAGGSWDDLSYLFGYFGAFPGFYSSSKLGFRCAMNSAGASSDQGAMRIDSAAQVPVYARTSEATFDALLSHYRYDRAELNAQVIERIETEDWRREKITYTGAADERVIAYLYLPKNYPKPFQVINFVPAGDVYGGYVTLAEALEMQLVPHIKSGRAVFAVVFKGFKERERPPDYIDPANSSVKRREEMVNRAIDLRRGLDYLETRDDIDASRLGYYGYSAGAEDGIIFTAVESRYKTVVLVACGISRYRSKAIAEASPQSFAPHIRAPKLLLNGRYDEAYAYKTEIEPFHKLLSEPKRIVLYDGSHSPPIEMAVPIVNNWLDETLGPVKRD